ncbi:hypothetical protein C8Q78DRAFT_407687 [Trametes maxima]|nr:hypothetical protein C8Q78DRAFT_407687 [Trametes maxima]
MFAPTQQPRWVLLSVFLFLWSLSSGLRRDGRSRTLGLGVDARAHMPVADTMLDMLEGSEHLGIWKRQVAIPTCAALCAAQAGDTVGCGEGLNLGCACHSPSFLPDTVNCMESNCTSKDSQLGQQAIQSACLRIGTSTTSSPTSTSFTATSTSITSGPPSICTTVTPTSPSVTTTVSVTVTITSSTPASAPSPTSTSATTSGSASASDTSIPVVTTTAMITTNSTVLLPSTSATRPVTTVTSTSTFGGVPTAPGTGNDTGAAGNTGQTGGAADTVGTGAVGAVLAVFVGVGAMLVL